MKPIHFFNINTVLWDFYYENNTCSLHRKIRIFKQVKETENLKKKKSPSTKETTP